jgi:hypothetical protein
VIQADQGLLNQKLALSMLEARDLPRESGNREPISDSIIGIGQENLGFLKGHL